MRRIWPVGFSILLLLAFCSLPDSTATQGSIHGKVVTRNQNGEPAVFPNARIVLHGPINREAQSDVSSPDPVLTTVEFLAAALVSTEDQATSGKTWGRIALVAGVNVGASRLLIHKLHLESRANDELRFSQIQEVLSDAPAKTYKDRSL
jgi:hypothetical protein